MPYAPLQETIVEIREKADALLERNRGKESELTEKLADIAQLRGWRVHRAPDPQGARDYVRDLAATTGATEIIRSDEEIFETVPMDGPLVTAGIEVTVMSARSGLSSEVLREKAASAGIGVTGVDYAIAETGSVVVIPRKGISRFVSLAPPIHVALVRPQDIVESLEDIFILRRLAYYQGDRDMGSYMNFITGPSRTADIEQTLVIGVHGPKEAHLVLLG